MSEIYVVTAGDYSMYKILTVFDDKQLADEFVRRHNDALPGARDWGEAEVETYEVNKAARQVTNGTNAIAFSMRRNGDNYFHEWQYDYDGPTTCKFGDWATPTGEQCAHFVIWAKDRDSAVKAANERRTQMIANGEWPGE